MKEALIDTLGSMAVRDIFAMFIGARLGGGCYREVYEYLPDASKVIKIEDRSQSFRNMQEWEIWQACPKQWRKWLAPCVSISPCGIALVQERVDTTIQRRPTDAPDFLTDFQFPNWGKLKGRLVCCDYGHHRFFSNGFKRARIRDARKQFPEQAKA